MKTIVAIGGGSFQKGETGRFDAYAIERTKQKHPKALLLPAASHDDQGYAKRFKQYYRSLGCEAEALRLWNTKLFTKALAQKVMQADLLYFGAGDTQMLMEALHMHALVENIIQAYEQGKVICGLSAGANILFTYGYSACENGFRLVEGCNLVKGLFCPHYQKEERKGFDIVCKQYPQLPAYGCEDKHAYCVEDDIIKLL